MKLITEQQGSVRVITEGEGDNKQLFIEGIFAQADTLNKNKRIYPKSVMEGSLNTFQSVIKANRAMGELNHPQGPTINLDRVSHLIVKMTMEGKDVFGKAKILPTPMGKIAKNLMEGGAQLGVSTRGLGDIRKNRNGLNEVQNGFIMKTVDLVGDPSAPEAFVNGILEGVDYFVTQTGEIEERIIAQLKKQKLTEERKLAAFKQFLNEIVGAL